MDSKSVEKFKRYVNQINVERKKAGEEHKKYLRKHPDRITGEDMGSLSVRLLYERIRGAVELAQALDLVDTSVEVSSFVK